MIHHEGMTVIEAGVDGYPQLQIRSDMIGYVKNESTLTL